MKKAVIIIPTYNEYASIGQTIDAVSKVLKEIDDWQMQVLVVDDHSPDKTYELVASLKKQYRFLELLINQKKSGLGGAYLKGMAMAFTEMKADVVFEFDADLSHDPQKIPQFLKKIDAGYDLVLGSRYIPGGSMPADWGLHRKFLSVVGNLFINLIMFDFSIRDWTTGYRAITKKVYENVHKDLETDRFSGYTFQIGFLMKTLEKGYKVAEVPFHFKDRTAGKSKMGPEYIKNTLIFLIRTRIKSLLQNRIVKFALVGVFGAVVQLGTLYLWRLLFSYQLATFLSIEMAVLSNFIWSNLWTFADRRLKGKEIPLSFIKFNLSSAGSILIQQVVAFLGETLIGLHFLFNFPIIRYPVDTGTLFAILGILLGMFWNFFAYNFFIWKKKKE